MEDEALRKEILVGFEYSYLHEDWVNPLREALAGLTLDHVRWKAEPEAKSIFEIVLHLATWNENIVERIRTGEPVGPADGHWPEPPAVQDSAAWDDAKMRLWESLDLMRATIDQAPMEKILGSHYGLGDLFCRFIHNAYHIGQITKLRECLEASDDIP